MAAPSSLICTIRSQTLAVTLILAAAMAAAQQAPVTAAPAQWRPDSLQAGTSAAPQGWSTAAAYIGIGSAIALASGSAAVYLFDIDFPVVLGQALVLSLAGPMVATGAASQRNEVVRGAIGARLVGWALYLTGLGTAAAVLVDAGGATAPIYSQDVSAAVGFVAAAAMLGLVMDASVTSWQSGQRLVSAAPVRLVPTLDRDNSGRWAAGVTASLALQ